MKKLPLFIFLLLLGVGLTAQSLRPADLVSDQKRKGQTFAATTLFQLANAQRQRVTELDHQTGTYDVLTFGDQQVQALLHSAPANLQLALPGQGRNDLQLELVQVDPFADGFSVIESPAERAIEVDLGVHYRGIVKGDDRSLVAISVFADEVMGLIATDAGNLVLGKLQGEQWQGEHILYQDADILLELGRSCDTPDDNYVYTREELTWTGSNDRALSDCVQLYYEVDYDVYLDKGAGTTNFVTGIHNQVATLYANEQINTEISEIIVWTQTSPYSSTSSSGMLSDFQNYRNGFNGDLASLFSYQASGGIAAGFNGICSSNPDNSMCFSSINSTYSTVPTYSWTVDLTTHELGHLFGSRHTHACVWNGNGTAIDGCYNTEGSCPKPGIPSGGGTIMSYCHLVSAGKDLSLGFGPQPGNVIRNSVTNGNCLQACGGGGGGGGSCSDNEATLTINLDNYPGETTWTLTNAGGSTIASGGPYSGAGSTVTEDFCLVDGCYTFTILDSYGDGICCGYGNGSYSITDASGNVLASGGSFGSSESSQICVGSGGGGGGGNCINVDFNTYPPSTYGGSQDNGTVDVLDANTIRLQNNAWKDINLSYTVTPNTVIEFEFGSTTQGEIHGIGFDDNNSISSNRTFKVHGTQNWGLTNYDNYSNVGYYTAYTIPVGQFYTGSFDRMFFVMDQDSGSGGNSYFRNIVIHEGGGCGMIEGGTLGQALPATANTSTEALLAFPNPTRDLLNLKFTTLADGEAQISVHDLSGRQLSYQQVGVAAGSNDTQLSLAHLPAGAYLVRIQTDTEQWTTRISVLH